MNDNSFLNEVGKNLPVIITAITAILSAFIGGLFTWLISRNQIRTKEYEIKNNVELRARELIYNSYQHKLHKLIQIIESNTKTRGELYATFLVGGFEENLDMVKKYCEGVKKIVKEVLNPYEEINKTIVKENITDNNILKKAHNIKILQNDILDDKRIINNYEEEFLQLNKFMSLLDDIDEDLIELKASQLFEKYL
jgi:hypothetical protein